MSPETMSEDNTELSDHVEVRPAPLVFPDDPHNRAFVANVRPSAWVNPSPKRRYNLVVIGAGAAGLSAATHAANLGARVALVERFLLGGDLFANGTLPSKALLAVARRAADARRSANFGLDSNAVAAADFGAAMERVRRLRASMSLRASAERYTDLGVDVYFGEPSFVSSTKLALGTDRLKFNYALIATGTRSTPLDLPGAADVETYTSETIFSLTEIPRHLVVIGGGPVGCELAQAFRRLGAQVTIVSREPRLLPAEDVEAASVLKAQLESEGVALALGATLTRLENRGKEKAVCYEVEGVAMEAVGDAILIAIGRTPDLDTLKLEAAGIERDEHGVKVNARLQTTCRRVFAAGDVCSTERYAHAAEAQARLAVNNALLFGLKRATHLIVPHAIYTEPEVAHVGLYEAQAQAQNLEFETLRVPLGEIDRAVLDGHGRGFAQVLYLPGRRGRILGATVVGRHAGEIIGEISLAMTAGLGLRHLSRTVHPYPTESEILKRLGDAFARGRRHPKLKEYLSRWFWLERLLP